MKKRILYLDILKVLALIFMAIIHTFGVFAYFEFINNESIINNTTLEMNILYLITPTIFMFCMGCGVVLSKNNTKEKLLKRGLHLLLVGFGLNIIRGSMFLILGFISDIEWIYEAWYWLWGSDILYFAGIWFLLFALAKYYKLSDKNIFIISLGMFIISNFLYGISTNNYTISMILGNLIYIDSDSYFPILSWSIIPTLGYLFQKKYNDINDKDKFIKTISISSIILLFSTILIMIITNTIDSRYFLWGEGNFIMDFPTLIITLSINGIYVSIAYLISKFIKKEKIIILINKISKNINIIYCIHWFILLYGALIYIILLNNIINSTLIINIIGILVFIISAILASLYSKKLAVHRSKLNE